MSSHIPLPEIKSENEEFRNSIGTMYSDGKRRWVYPKKPPERKFYKARTWVSYVLIAILVVTPFLRWNGNPLFKFDIINREFFVFGYPFFPSDFYIFAIAGITTAIGIILFTVIYGRIFCGWVCPQTIFLEMVFRKIEYAIEGDRNKQMRLDRQEWDEEKIRKRGLKWFIYAILSFLIANVFLAYIIGSDALFDLVVDGPLAHSETFIGLVIFTGIFYFVFTWFREQACTLVCPYGRLQGVLIDKKTIIVAYDHKRGEGEAGRAKFKKNEDRKKEGKGDCIDCGQCVAVCPTGIDIRNGTQLECVNCTACIDACDDIMERIDLPTGLIRYASEENIESGKKFKFTTRMIAYTVVLGILITVTTAVLFMRPDVAIKCLREPGSKYAVENTSTIVNTYQYTLTNKTVDDQKVHFELKSHPGEIKVLSGPGYVLLGKGMQEQGKLKIYIEDKDLANYKEEIEIVLVNDKNEELSTYTTNFAGPFK